MKALKLPIYFYEENTSNQIGVGDTIILQDNAIVDAYKGYTSDHLLYRWQDIQLTSVSKVVNEYLGIPLLSSKLNFYSKIISGTTYPNSATLTCDLLSVRGVPVILSDNTEFAKNYVFKTLDNYVFSDYLAGVSYNNNPPPPYTATYGNAPYCNMDVQVTTTPPRYNVNIYVYSENLFDDEGNVVEAKRDDGVVFNIIGGLANDFKSATSASLYVRKSRFGAAFNIKRAQAEDIDVNNPYSDDGDEGDDGDNTDPTITEGMDVPALPSVGASDFVTIYNPSASDLNALSDFLWSPDNIFDLDNYKKLYEDPMECLIGLAVLPCLPTAQGTKNIKFGNIDTGVNSTYLTSQWAEVDCGSVSIKTTANSFMDYSPHVKIQLFLPFIGFQSLDADDVMGASIKVVYHVDVLSGDCIAFVKHSSRGVIYSYTGNCLANIPMTAGSYAGALKNYYQQLAHIFPSMIQGGAAGGAAGAAAAGAGGLVNAAESIAFNTRPTYQRSGTVSGAAGIMGIRKPFIIIERPNVSVPDYVQRYAGLSANVTRQLGSLSGFTTCDYVHLEGLTATEAELNEIESLLHSGVIL